MIYCAEETVGLLEEFLGFLERKFWIDRKKSRVSFVHQPEVEILHTKLMVGYWGQLSAQTLNELDLLLHLLFDVYLTHRSI